MGGDDTRIPSREVAVGCYVETHSVSTTDLSAVLGPVLGTTRPSHGGGSEGVRVPGTSFVPDSDTPTTAIRFTEEFNTGLSSLGLVSQYTEMGRLSDASFWLRTAEASLDSMRDLMPGDRRIAHLERRLEGVRSALVGAYETRASDMAAPLPTRARSEPVRAAGRGETDTRPPSLRFSEEFRNALFNLASAARYTEDGRLNDAGRCVLHAEASLARLRTLMPGDRRIAYLEARLESTRRPLVTALETRAADMELRSAAREESRPVRAAGRR